MSSTYAELEEKLAALREKTERMSRNVQSVEVVTEGAQQLAELFGSMCVASPRAPRGSGVPERPLRRMHCAQHSVGKVNDRRPVVGAEDEGEAS